MLSISNDKDFCRCYRERARVRVEQHLVALARVGHEPEGPAGAQLMTPPDPPKRPIGFVTPEDKKKDKN